jgi:hypothetical protein
MYTLGNTGADGSNSTSGVRIAVGSKAVGRTGVRSTALEVLLFLVMLW